ncbi:unnamed protein product [Didymodactylos carnosus]|uniref:ABC transporter domain-containing protein n=1 Tax=Didymodactylos carnosus TaxID=1234261 RepID=A0A8S2CKB9_9BILA|nr:unnamed protein product [Didymodactylos carnosus]CAF3499364.1 unnamed protein product [Didymodactylos carnosus]
MAKKVVKKTIKSKSKVIKPKVPKSTASKKPLPKIKKTVKSTVKKPIKKIDKKQAAKPKVNSVKRFALEMFNISKRFGTIVANEKINLQVEKGTIHALIGENGAGKSTLMSILFGLYHPDSGIIKINDTVVNVNSPQKANALGIGMVHQHFKLVDNFSVLENIVLGAETLVSGTPLISAKSDHKRVLKTLEKYQLEIDLKKKISSLSVAEQQRVEIVKMLYRESDILILDEPTAVLSPNEIPKFLDYLVALKKLGKTIIIISHKLKEIKQIADYGTVIRHGKSINSFKMSEVTIPEIVEMMVGVQVIDIVNPHIVKNEGKQIVAEFDHISVGKIGNKGVIGLNDFNLQINAGEIVGIAGVEGNGQTELANAISGMSKTESGNIFLTPSLTTSSTQSERKNLTNLSIEQRFKSGLAFVSEDRHKFGSILGESYRAAKKEALKIIGKFDVRNNEGGAAIMESLSGGNQQKVILGRELSSPFSLLVLCQPTRGLDVKAVANVHKKILEAKGEGKAILLISYELDEIINLSDRVKVLYSGKTVGELKGKEISYERIGKMMIGEA